MNESNKGHPTPEQKALMEALRRADERAEAVPGASSTDLWPAVRERVRAAPTREPRPAPLPRRGIPGRSRLRLVCAAALAALMLAGGAAYAGGGIGDALDRVFDRTVPTVHVRDLATPVNEERTREGATVSIDRVYADTGYVAVAYSVEGRDAFARRNGVRPIDLSDWLRLHGSQEAGGGAGADSGYAIADALWQGWAPGAREPAPPEGSTVGAVLFEAPEGLDAGEGRRFRAEVYFDGPTGRVQKNGALEVERVGRPFLLDFEVPVREAPTIEVDQTVESGGVPITLTEVVNSPAGTRAYLCFDPPEGRYDWPLVKTGLFGRGRLADAPVHHTGGGALREGCATYKFDDTLYDKPGMHSLTITELHAGDQDVGGSVQGPWRFRFEVPEP
ncbi:MAG: hypothetical protein AVDCRST_MAG12-3391 [uncultured Rubrobacteraceae bacterium]|uniref:DUF4179 domain-containing protein n=1 Tax=uncultured Rubrobacteraceae bacterium TaxID=349277 RepID=A0A6J4T655_9ACTN|nr:MAG: hypothetical protein AVDCRST_MAG12-3391 [uncultured Rubrobacteraceae bacterium]